MAENIKVDITLEVGDLNALVLGATEQAFMEVTAELTARFDAAVSGQHWPWPDSTPRWGSSGGKTLKEVSENWNTYLTGSGTGVAPKSVAGSPRSIVDSGDLKQSREFTLNKKALTAQWTWNVDYAAAVHNGAYIHPFGNKSKLVQLPGRPWTTAVLEGGTVATGIPVYNPAQKIGERIGQLVK